MRSRAKVERRLRWYGAALCLLPPQFRARYGAAMLQSVCDALADGSEAPMAPGPLLADLLTTAAREWSAAGARCLMKHPIAVYSAALIVLLCAFSLISAMVSQQLLRRSANQPQQQMAERYARELAAGADPTLLLPAGHVDPSRDLDPFIIFYDAARRPLQSSATLRGGVPAPPAGVFAEAARHGSNILTWMPQHDTRIAMVLLRIDGAHPGFLLVGRSLSVTELYEGVVYHAAVASMAAILLLIAVAGVLLARAFRAQPPAPLPSSAH